VADPKTDETSAPTPSPSAPGADPRPAASEEPGATAATGEGGREGPDTAKVRRTYTERRRTAQAAADAADRTADRLGNVRLALALVGLVLLLWPLASRTASPWWGLLPVAVAFFAVGVLQDRALERRRRHRAEVRYHAEGLARIDESWRDLGDTGEAAGNPWRHTLHYADDLDLFGRASLFQLLNRAHTQRGQDTLARWLCEPATVDEATARQRAAENLAENLDFRVALAAAAASEDATSLDDQAIRRWAEVDAPIPVEGLLRVLAWLHPVALFATYLVYQLGGPGQPLAIAVLAQLSTLFFTRKVVGSRLEVLSGPERALRRAARLVEAVETARLEAEWLREVQAPLQQGPASHQIRRLERLVNLLDARLNVIFALTIGPALMWDLNLVLRAERWRRTHGLRVTTWFEAVGRMEAAASMGGLAYERPEYAFPEFVSDEPGVFEAESLHHPLIDRHHVVANDLTLNGPGSVLLLSGSNMSGKSTLLRSVGLAVVLARAGGPVPARRLKLSPFELATSVRVVDSLAEGTSHFFAELKRLKHIVDEGRRLGPGLLYLLDEVLHGTNSRERYIGAVSVIRHLSQQGAVGIVTTHDLGLARVAEELPPHATRNCHFSDQVEGDDFSFDYRLREGPVRSTNALRLMRAVGIDLDFHAPEADEDETNR
jgi:hypothetical protein